MAGSDNNDVINNQNHVVDALQGEHNKLSATDSLVVSIVASHDRVGRFKSSSSKPAEYC